jgi:hypothetical protein
MGPTWPLTQTPPEDEPLLDPPEDEPPLLDPPDEELELEPGPVSGDTAPPQATRRTNDAAKA